MQSGSFGDFNASIGIRELQLAAVGKVLGRFHSSPPFALRGRDSSPPRQRKSHSSHSWLLRYRRPRKAKRQGGSQRNLRQEVICFLWVNSGFAREGAGPDVPQICSWCFVLALSPLQRELPRPSELLPLTALQQPAI